MLTGLILPETVKWFSKVFPKFVSFQARCKSSSESTFLLMPCYGQAFISFFFKNQSLLIASYCGDRDWRTWF